MVESTQHAPTTKYVIKAKFEVEGVVEKPDVVGAIFGQTEGLFGPDLDLRELQKSGRVGRIEISLESKHDKTTGTIVIPSSLDKPSTAIIAAAIESVDRIGPCIAKVTMETIHDEREEKRRAITNKAKEILQKWVVEGTPSSDEIVKEVSGIVRTAEVVGYGPEGLPAGPEIDQSNSIIIVEGRADVINLLRCGIKNAISLEGTKVPESVIQLSKTKETTAFLDGDRAGDLILKELGQVAEVEYVARAPAGKEVEELTPKEVLRCLRERVTVEQAEKTARPRLPLPENVVETAKQLRGTLEAVVFDENVKEVARMSVSELAEKLPQINGAHTLVFDGIITQRLLDVAEGKSLKIIVGDRIAEVAKRPFNIKLMTMSDVA